MHTAGAVAKAIIPIIHRTDKPVIIALMGEKLIQEAVEHFRAARVPEYRFPERAASALAILAERAEFLQRDLDPPLTCCDVDREAVNAILSSPAAPALEITEFCSMLTAYGIATPQVGLAKTVDEAVRLAERFGYPVALKIASPDIPHKSDVGGVLLKLKEAQTVMHGFAAIVRNARLARPHADIRGVHVQRMLNSGQEVIIGAVQDPQFGPLVMFGSGGVEVERLGDVAFALAPVTREEAEFLLESTWAGRRLKGYRSLAPADREAVIDTLMRVAQLVADFPQIAEIEINPLRVLPEGQGAFAVDVRGRLQTNEDSP
jgi:acetyltransferase